MHSTLYHLLISIVLQVRCLYKFEEQCHFSCHVGCSVCRIDKEAATVSITSSLMTQRGAILTSPRPLQPIPVDIIPRCCIMNAPCYAVVIIPGKWEKC